MGRGPKITRMKKIAVIAQSELGIPHRKIAKNMVIHRQSVLNILAQWREKKEEDFIPYIALYKKRLAETCLNNAARCFDLSDKDIYKKSSPYQRVGMGSMMVEKALLLMGQATSIVAYEEVDEDIRARYLKMIEEKKKIIDVTSKKVENVSEKVTYSISLLEDGKAIEKDGNIPLPSNSCSASIDKQGFG